MAGIAEQSEGAVCGTGRGRLGGAGGAVRCGAGWGGVIERKMCMLLPLLSSTRVRRLPSTHRTARCTQPWPHRP